MLYGFVKDGHVPQPLTWHSIADCLPKMEEDLGGIWRSRPVLLWLGTHALVGYLQEWEDAEYVAEWKLAGRDSYAAEGVTHWRWLPMPPNNVIDKKEVPR
jgi:hypothetical protein